MKRKTRPCGCFGLHHYSCSILVGKPLTLAESRVFNAMLKYDHLVNAAAELGIAKNTLKCHLRRIYTKKGVKSHVGLVQQELQKKEAEARDHAADDSIDRSRKAVPVPLRQQLLQPSR